MQILVNEAALAVDPPIAIGDLLARQGISPAGTAIALNDAMVPRSLWATTPLAEGDRLLVIRAARGG